ncbi:T3SS (YopN, CesT) and YbjN peptide-binding chaperone 1 [Nocardioides maradonensis]
MSETTAWIVFEQALSAYVGGMTDADDHLDLDMAGTLHACFLVNAPGDVQVTLPSENTQACRPVELAVDLARLAVAALRDGMHLAHPHLLTMSASGPQAALRSMLGLEDSQDVPNEPGGPAAPVALAVEDRDELNAAIATVLKAKYGEEPTLDSDNDFVLTHMDQPVWVHAFADRPAVRIMARVAHNVKSRRQAAIELTILNRDSVYVTWTLRGREVWQQTTIYAAPFAPAQLDDMVDVFLSVMSETRDDLALRLGAGVA